MVVNLLRASGLCLFYLAVVLPAQSLAASTERPTCSFTCFAQYLFDGSCLQPYPGAKLYSGRLLSISHECPNTTILHIQTKNRELPPVVEIQLRGCKIFAGRSVNEIVEFGVQDPSADVQRYPLACDLR
ncbi:hypothetical protein XI05_01095 [Bradyrhizobium sp. CCBAU 11357]|nr:hypothetical protein [Bradyrhizobium sp. CCBAU 11357]